MAKRFLGPSRESVLEEKVVEVSARRSAAVEGAEAERRRIERDLHDGAQQRLVALGMTIGMAKEKLDSDPESAKLLLNEAHAEAKSAMAELRSIARGIHPAVLDDRGLDAALSAIAARAPIPVSINIDLPERVGTTIEGTAYYVVSEALTNIAKHADATHAFVNVDRLLVRDRETIVVTVTDNGSGGAAFSPDGGLVGLRDRVAGIGGTLYLSSPIGGPTTLTAELPR
jgi:signal transduction histidine kinase